MHSKWNVLMRVWNLGTALDAAAASHCPKTVGIEWECASPDCLRALHRHRLPVCANSLRPMKLPRRHAIRQSLCKLNQFTSHAYVRSAITWFTLTTSFLI
jgi:hypothetical protein